MNVLPWRSIMFYLYLVYVFYVIAITLKIVLDNRHPQVTMSWLLAIFFLPYIGVILYTFAGVDWKKKKIVKNRPEEYFGDQLTNILERQRKYLQRQQSDTDNDSMKVLTLLLNSSNSVITLDNRVRTFFSGERMFRGCWPIWPELEARSIWSTSSGNRMIWATESSTSSWGGPGPVWRYA